MDIEPQAVPDPEIPVVSIVELGMYEMTAQIHRRLGERGLKTGSDEFERAFEGFDFTASSRRKASTSAGDSAIFGTSETSA